MAKDYGPQISAGRLYERTSANGNVYISGRLGPLRLTLLRSKETGDNGETIWELKLSEAPPYQPREPEPNGSDGQTEKRDARGAKPRTFNSKGRRNWQAPLNLGDVTTEIPF